MMAPLAGLGCEIQGGAGGFERCAIVWGVFMVLAP
jgi:hypothetical protein